MDMFEKATKAVKNAGESVIDSAKSIGNTIYSTTKEQRELAGLKVQKSVIERKLQEFYAEIGKRYVEYTANASGEAAFDVSDILDRMQSNLEKIAEIDNMVAEKELNIKKEEEARTQKKAQDEYDSEKAKLDKALEMDIISQGEYSEKMRVVQRRFDNHEQIRKIELQLQMGIITREEYRDKINNLLK